MIFGVPDTVRDYVRLSAFPGRSVVATPMLISGHRVGNLRLLLRMARSSDKPQSCDYGNRWPGFSFTPVKPFGLLASINNAPAGTSRFN
jgi:hypothetical protein